MSKDKNSKQMSLLEDSPANHSVLQENKKELTTTVISGQKCLDSSKKLNQSSLLGRMCKALLTSKTAWYSDRCKTNWKVKVSKSNVSLFQLQASVLGTKETESGLWATPNTMDYLPPRSAAGTKKLMEGHRKGRTKPSNLREQVDPETMKLYPTPNARDWKDSVNKVPPSVGKTRGHSLGQRIAADNQKRMYPTPRTGGGSRPNGKGGKVLEEEVMIEYGLRERGKTLKQMFPTPSASCQMDVVAPPETVEKNSSGWSVRRVGTGTKFGAKLNDVVNKVSQPVEPGGKLNPTFVEFLMGFPESWTKIEPTE